MKTLVKSLLLSGAAALVIGSSLAAPAQAGGKKLHFHPHHHHKHFHGHGWGPKIYIGGGYGGYGCGYYKRMFWKTGNYYWKAKYYDCLY